ncbi:hypothetical protein SAY87_014232 [Trapa incisa]|uniref:Zinc finger PHD-type domain-containing protein n=1 Tax=Trapa incisa TaxID=236973 RepID=A0AAN7GND1_9MYRT|nr:hypothetical protein SAY87_014232 [Trapa incisa]
MNKLKGFRKKYHCNHIKLLEFSWHLFLVLLAYIHRTCDVTTTFTYSQPSDYAYLCTIVCQFKIVLISSINFLQADICQTCGSAGYSEALIYCYSCEEVAVHRYCLEIIPKTFDEYVYWYCDDCKPQNHELGHMEEPRSPPDEGNDSKCLKSSISTSPEEDDQQNLDAAKSAQPSISEEKLRKRLTMIKITEDLKGGNEWKDSPCLIAGTDAHIAESGQLSWPICNQEDANSHGGNSPSSNLESENATFQVPDPAENLSALATLDLSKSAMDIDYVPAQTIIDPIWRGSLQIRKHSSNLEIENATFQVEDPAENLSALPALDSPKSAMDIDYVPAQPIIDPIWRGSLQIRKHRGVYSCKIVAHMSQLACARVTEEAKLFPETLYSELQPRLTLWPKGFEGCGPVDDNIALYLFPRSKRDENVFKKIICEMIRNDLAIRATVTHAELLVFSSTKLPLRLWSESKNLAFAVFSFPHL